VHKPWRRYLLGVTPQNDLGSWFKHVREAQHWYNNSPNRAMGGITPYAALHGMRGRNRVDNLMSSASGVASLAEWTSLINACQTWVEMQNEMSSVRDKADLDANYKKKLELDVGQHALVFYPTRPDKMHAYWKGPYIVQKRDADRNYFTVAELCDGSVGKPMEVHVSRLRKYDMTRTNLRAEALKKLPEGYLLVTGVRGHRSKTDHPTELEFDTTWSDGTTTWEPATSIRRMEHFKAYTKTHKLIGRMNKQAAEENKRLRGGGHGDDTDDEDD
jgi:hypothetical protein